MTASSVNWASIDTDDYPKLATDVVPGPKSRQIHNRASDVMKGYFSQARLFPVAFESGRGARRSAGMMSELNPNFVYDDIDREVWQSELDAFVPSDVFYLRVI